MITHENINDLKPHPRNAEFFDDITGEKWTEFLESIKQNGVIEPIIITPNKIIVSGHQRVRACKELGFDEIECITKQYKDEDAVLLDLLESNIRQRGDVGGSMEKIVRRGEELERLYGVREGSHGTSRTTLVSDEQKTQTEIAEELGISKTTYQNYKKLVHAIPEMTDAIESGVVSQQAALAIMKQLSEDEQIELLSGLDAAKKYTQKETESLIMEIAELKAKPAEVVEKIPADYDSLKHNAEQARQEKVMAEKKAQNLKEENRLIRDDLQKRTSERDKYRDQIKTLQATSQADQKVKHQIETAGMFDARITKFIEEVGGYVWLTDEINELPDMERYSFIKSIQKVKDWATQMEYNIQEKMGEIENGK